MVDIEIAIELLIKQTDYECLRQEKLNIANDNLYTGIYKTDVLKTSIYIVCCNRIIGDVCITLDYTSLSATMENAEIKYTEMINNINLDLER